jgi:2-octaprenylphenol hydroxylase
MSGFDFDVIIVGGGLAGASLACALGSSALNVVVVEGQAPSAEMPPLSQTVDGFDARVSALTAASQTFLDQLGVWQLICQQRLCAYRQMHVWDAEGTGFVDFDAAAIHQPALGHIVENRVTVAAFMARLREHRNVQLLAPVKVAGLVGEPSRRGLALDDGREIYAPIIVAADGANSRIRQAAGFATREWDYGHHAIVATVKTEQPHRATAWQRFLPEGPLAFLPLAGDEQCFSSIVWSATPQYAENLMALSDEEFCQQLERAFEARLGAVESISRRFSFPLRQRHAVDYVQPGLALVGDAAHTIHPLAGQGINLGLQDVQVLAEEILRAQARGLPLTEPSILSRYQRRRKAENLTMMAAMEGFKRLFETPALPLRWLRNTGMHCFNRAEPIKHAVIRRAMGL